MELGKNDKKGCVTMLRIKDEFLKGVSLTPAFIIEPMDEEYEISENLFRFDEAEFNEKIRCTGFAANEGDVDKIYKF